MSRDNLETTGDESGSELCRIALRDFLENIVASFPYSAFSQRWPLVFQSNHRTKFQESVNGNVT